jgi:hypothetical protein
LTITATTTDYEGIPNSSTVVVNRNGQEKGGVVDTLKIRAREIMDGAEAFLRQYDALSSNGRYWVRVLFEDDLSLQGAKEGHRP